MEIHSCTRGPLLLVSAYCLCFSVSRCPRKPVRRLSALLAPALTFKLS